MEDDRGEWKSASAWSPSPTDTFASDRVEAFIVGEATIGNLRSMTKEQAESIAELGRGLLRAGNQKEAQMIFQGLVISYPNDVSFHSILASIYERLGMVDGAIEEYSVVIALEPGNLEAYVDRGALMMHEGDFERAAADFRRVINADPSSNDPIVVRAKVMAGATAAALRTQKE